MQHTNPTSDRFDERAVGLDHFALRVPDRAALEAWAKHFDDLGVPHSGIQEESGGPLIVFRDPDNIQLELWAVDVAYCQGGVERPEFELNVVGVPKHDQRAAALLLDA